MKKKELELGVVLFVLIAVLIFSSVIGYTKGQKADILVSWNGGTPDSAADVSPTFEVLNTLHLGNPFWFLK